MDRRSIVLAIAACSMLMAGCQNLTSPARSHTLKTAKGTVYWMDYTASRRGTFIFPASSELKMCAEPVPDVALAQTSELVGKATIKGAPVELQAKFASEVVQLAGRTQMVLFLRESMYRLCEQELNGTLTKAQVFELYQKVVEAAVRLATATAAEATLQGFADPETRAYIEDLLDD